jgi:hypothetical protein
MNKKRKEKFTISSADLFVVNAKYCKETFNEPFFTSFNVNH